MSPSLKAPPSPSPGLTFKLGPKVVVVSSRLSKEAEQESRLQLVPPTSSQGQHIVLLGRNCWWLAAIPGAVEKGNVR